MEVISLIIIILLILIVVFMFLIAPKKQHKDVTGQVALVSFHRIADYSKISII